MPDTLIRFKTGDLSKMDNGATDEVSINNGTVYFATDDTTKNGKIYFDSPEGDRIDMTAYAKESDYATLAGNIDGVVSVANGGTGATDAATARTNLGIPIAGTTATAVGTTANGGSATTWSKSDHVHNITLTTGDNNGQIKIAGTNVSVKGLGSAAYTESSSYASAANEIEHLKDGSAEGSLRATGTAEESSTYTMGEYAVAFGSGTKASGTNSIAIGRSTKAESNPSYAEGWGTSAKGSATHAEGRNNTAVGLMSHVEGYQNVSIGMGSHAEGGGVVHSVNLNGAANTLVYTLTTPLEVYPYTRASSSLGFILSGSDGAVAKVTNITKSGNNITGLTLDATLDAENAITDKNFAWVEGNARGNYSHVEGTGNVAIGASQHVSGKYCIPDSTSAEIIGNGTNDVNRSNARTLDWSGNETLAGKLTVGTDPINNMDVATKQYVDNAFAMNDAIIFKGILNSPSEVPSTHRAGWTYRIGTTGTYVGQICEVGDLLICISDGTEASNNDWNIVQNNLDGALFKGTNTFIDGQVLIADGVTGKTKTSGFTIGKSVPSDALFTDTIYTHPSTTATAAAAVKVGNDSLGHVILGNALTANDLNSVAYIEQNLTLEQKNQARENIGIKNLIDGSSAGSLRQLSAYPETAGVYSLGSYAIALGSGTRASGASSIAEGSNTIASGTDSHAEGSWSESTALAAHAEGDMTKASSSYAHAEGSNTLAAVAAGHTEGEGTIAYGTLASHAEGCNTMSSGMYSHAEGRGVTYTVNLNGDAGATTYTLTTPVEIYPWNMSSSTLGYVCANNAITKARIKAITKSGNNVTSITVNETLNAGAAISGTNFTWVMPQARGAQSHTEGLGSVALGSSQHVGGQYNIPDSTSLEIIGNGTSNLIRSNARTLDKNGNEVLSGKLTVGTQAVNANDVTTLAQVQTLIADYVNGLNAEETEF